LNNTKEYWFYIDTYVHICVKKDWILLYNSLTGKILEYRNKPEILKRIKQLQSPRNLLVIPLTEKEIKHPEVSAFVNDVSSYFMGDLIETAFSKRKPIQLMPIVKIQKDVKYLKNDAGRSVGEDMMKYLTEVTLYLNSECSQQCSICRNGYKQFTCCTARDNHKKELELDKLKDFWEQIKSSSLSNVNILGGDIFAYSRIDGLLDFVKPHAVLKSFYLHYLNAASHSDRLAQLVSDSSQLKILVDFPLKEEALFKAIHTAQRAGLKVVVIFIISKETEFEKAEAMVSSMSIQEPVFQPYYNGKNRKMFEENIYTDREELMESNPSLKEIYSREVINTSNFGRLTILDNSHIYANVNANALGILGKDLIHDIIYKELYNGKSWRKTRKNVMPCKQCVFQSLCPPLSNLNIALGQNNLCTIF
jgi:pseudo-rSAM protein